MKNLCDTHTHITRCVTIATICSWTLSLRAAWVASGCDGAEDAQSLHPALRTHPVLSTCPCKGGLFERSMHIMKGLTFINPWVGPCRHLIYRNTCFLATVSGTLQSSPVHTCVKPGLLTSDLNQIGTYDCIFLLHNFAGALQCGGLHDMQLPLVVLIFSGLHAAASKVKLSASVCLLESSLESPLLCCLKTPELSYSSLRFASYLFSFEDVP